MFNRINNKVDRFMEQVKLGADIITFRKYLEGVGGLILRDENIVGNIEGYSIYFDKAMKGFGTICAVSSHSESEGYVIIIDNYFSRLSTVAKKFVLYHELGHIINDHLRDSIERGITDLEIVQILDLEKIADEYAYDRLGLDAINGLIELRDMVAHLILDENVLNALNVRLDSLKEKASVL